MPSTRRSSGRGRSGSRTSTRTPNQTQNASQTPNQSRSQSRSLSSRTGSRRGEHGGRASGGNGRHQGRAMIESLEEGFLTEIADMLDGENQLVKTLQKFAGSVESPQLRNAFERHLDQTHDHVHRLEQIFGMFGRKPETDRCEGIQGIVTEGDELLRKAAQGPLRDAMVIAAAQKAEHYEIAAYGSLCAWADQLGEDRAVRLLEETLSEEKMADRTLTRIAESFSNVQAPERRGEREYGRGGAQFGRYNERAVRGGESDRGRQFGEDRNRWEEEDRDRGFQGGMRGRGEWQPPYSDAGFGDHSRSRYEREKRYDE